MTFTWNTFSHKNKPVLSCIVVEIHLGANDAQHRSSTYHTFEVVCQSMWLTTICTDSLYLLTPNIVDICGIVLPVSLPQWGQSATTSVTPNSLQMIWQVVWRLAVHTVRVRGCWFTNYFCAAISFCHLYVHMLYISHRLCSSSIRVNPLYKYGISFSVENIGS